MRSSPGRWKSTPAAYQLLDFAVWQNSWRCHAAERLSPGLDNNIVRYVNSLVMHDAVPAQHEPLLFHGEVPLALPATTKSVRFRWLRYFNFSHPKRRFQNLVQSAAR